MGQGSQGGQAGHDLDRKLSRAEASHAVTGLGWRLVLGDLRTEVLTGSLPLAADVAARAAALPHAEGHLRMDIRQDLVVLMLQTATAGWVTPRDVELAHRITAVAEEFRLTTRAGTGEAGTGEAGTGQDGRSVQLLEVAIDVLDMAKVRPFWQAVLGYADEPGQDGPPNGLIDPLGQGPASGSSRWTPRARSVTASTWTFRCRTTRRISASRTRSRPEAGCFRRRSSARSGCWPTPRATRRASAPGRAATPAASAA